MKRLAQVIPLAKSDKSGCLCGGMLVYRMHGLRDVGRLSAKLLQSLQTVVTSQVERDFPSVRGAPLAGGPSVSLESKSLREKRREEREEGTGREEKKNDESVTAQNGVQQTRSGLGRGGAHGEGRRGHRRVRQLPPDKLGTRRSAARGPWAAPGGSEHLENRTVIMCSK